MRRLTLLLLLLLPLPLGAQEDEPGSPYGVRENLTSRDKAYHFTISAVGAGVGYTVARKLGMKRVPAIVVSAGLVGAAGLLREVDDGRRTGKYFSEKDLLWNGAGITVGIWIPDRFLFPRKEKEPPG